MPRILLNKRAYLLYYLIYLELKKANDIPTKKGERINLLKFKTLIGLVMKDRINIKITYAI
jgi:hypothetical protein